MALECVEVAVKLINSQGDILCSFGALFCCRETLYVVICDNSKSLRKLEKLVHSPVKCSNHLKGIAHE